MSIEQTFTAVTEEERSGPQGAQLEPYHSLPTLKATIHDAQHGPEIRFTHGIQGGEFISTPVPFDVFIDYALGLIDYRYSAVDYQDPRGNNGGTVRFRIVDVEDVNDVLVDLILADIDRVGRGETPLFSVHTQHVMEQIRIKTTPPRKGAFTTLFGSDDQTPFIPPTEIAVAREVLQRPSRNELRSLIMGIFADSLGINARIATEETGATTIIAGALTVTEAQGVFDIKSYFNMHYDPSYTRSLTIETEGGCIILPQQAHFTRMYFSTCIDLGSNISVQSLRTHMRQAPVQNPLRLVDTEGGRIITNTGTGELTITINSDNTSSVRITKPINGSLNTTGYNGGISATSVSGDLTANGVGNASEIRCLTIGGVATVNNAILKANSVHGHLRATNAALVIDRVGGNLDAIACNGKIGHVEGERNIMDCRNLTIGS